MSEAVYLVMYRAKHEGEEVRAVCSSQATAKAWAKRLKAIQARSYGFDSERERFDVDAWSVLHTDDTDEA